jgi:hypothetical protein
MGLKRRAAHAILLFLSRMAVPVVTLGACATSRLNPRSLFCGHATIAPAYEVLCPLRQFLMHHDYSWSYHAYERRY